MNEKNLRNEIAKNPLMILLLGACPAMGATATLLGSVGMGAAVLLVMLLSGIVMAALKNIVPACARIPACVLVIAGFASIMQMLMNAFLPEIYQLLGVYVAVVAVDLLVFSAVDGKGSVGAAVSAAVKTGLVFLVILCVMGVVREVLGSASIAGQEIAFLKDYRIPVLTMAPGGLMVYGIVAAVVSKLAPAGAMCTDLACCKKSEEVEQ